MKGEWPQLASQDTGKGIVAAAISPRSAIVRKII
jgi:hypothetical protein